MNFLKMTTIALLVWPLILLGKPTSALNESNPTKMLVQKYYDTLLVQDLSGFLSVLSEEVVHEINQGTTEVGKPLFKKFMEDQFSSGKINIKHLIILTSPDGKFAMSHFDCSGEYTHGKAGYPEAKGQHWDLPIVSFFKVENQHITHVAVYFNTKEWLRQIS